MEALIFIVALFIIVVYLISKSSKYNDYGKKDDFINGIINIINKVKLKEALNIYLTAKLELKEL